MVSILNKKRIPSRLITRVVIFSALTAFAINCVLLVILVKSKEHALVYTDEESTLFRENQKNDVVIPFPIGVDPIRKIIREDPFVDSFISEHMASNYRKTPRHSSLLSKIAATLFTFDWYQNLASPSGRVLVIRSGERAEEIATSFGKILGWNFEERTLFREIIQSHAPELSDGKFFPGFYHVTVDATPEFVANMVTERFDRGIRDRYTADIETLVPLTDALIIASLLEREAYDFEDMRYISGIIWNRLFIDMKLQLDASLQYAKGSNAHQPWWPKVVPNDKFIESPYNTYLHKGLPPTPIANPSVDAIVATLNPRKTDCLFYFHDARGRFFCSNTYEEHVAELTRIYGQGR